MPDGQFGGGSTVETPFGGGADRTIHESKLEGNTHRRLYFTPISL